MRSPQCGTGWQVGLMDYVTMLPRNQLQKFAKASLNHRVTLQAQPGERVLGKIRQNESLKQYCCLASAGNEGG